MKIAITGGAGFLGTYLTRAYLDAGHDVFVIDTHIHSFRQDIDPRARFYQVDIRDEKLRTILQQERPDIVSHHAALPPPLAEEQALADADIQVRGLLNVLDGCVQASVRRIIYASSGNTLYGPVEREALPLSENYPLCPCSAHDIHKATGEWYVRYYTQQFALKHTILRYADVYGDTSNRPMGHPLSYFITMMRGQQRPVIRGTGENTRDMVFIDDVVQANLVLLTRGENQTLHISSGQGYALNQIYREVAQQLGSTLSPLYLSGPLSATPTIMLDNSRARQILGWMPIVSLEEGIQRTIARFPSLRVNQAQRLETWREQYEERAPITDKLAITSEISLSRI